MTRFAIQCVLLTLVLMKTTTGTQAPASGSIEGTVVDSVSSAPMARARVTLSRTGGREVASLTTDLDGRFVIANIEPGEYRLSASRDGFTSAKRSSPVAVVAGSKTIIVLGLVPYGVISGRVVDWDGLPMVGIQVQALTLWPNDRGIRALFPSRSAQTNDLGEYRIYWVPPGSYFVRADPGNYGIRPRELLLSQVVASSTPEPQQYVSTYFPNSVDAAGARLFGVRIGETISGTDIRLVEMRKVQVSGVVSVPASGAPADLRLTPRNPASGISDYTTSADRNGLFEFDNVIPGSYILTADTINAARVATFGRIAVDVGNKDVENLAVTLGPGFDLRIRLVIEGRPRRSGDPQLVVNLKAAIPSTPIPTIERNGEEEFTMHQFMPGDYSVAVLSLNSARSSNDSPANGGLYLKSAQFGGSDVLMGGLHIEGPTSGVLEIAMADGAEKLSGSVLDDEKTPVSDVTVVLVPEPRLRGRSDLYKTATTDAAGKFDMSGIAPGQYKAFAWETNNQGAWQYPDFLELYEDRGLSIRIDGERKEPISVQLIPRLH
jgi:hypothetical protein